MGNWDFCYETYTILYVQKGSNAAPSLRVHKLRGVEGLWEFSVTMNYRVLFEIEGERYILLDVGPHRIVDRI